MSTLSVWGRADEEPKWRDTDSRDAFSESSKYSHITLPFHRACAQGNVEGVRAFLSYHKDFDADDNRPISLCAQYNQVAVLKILLDRNARVSGEAYQLAALTGNTLILKTLLAHGNQINGDYWTNSDHLMHGRFTKLLLLALSRGKDEAACYLLSTLRLTDAFLAAEPEFFRDLTWKCMWEQYKLSTVFKAVLSGKVSALSNPAIKTLLGYASEEFPLLNDLVTCCRKTKTDDHLFFLALVLSICPKGDPDADAGLLSAFGESLCRLDTLEISRMILLSGKVTPTIFELSMMFTNAHLPPSAKKKLLELVEVLGFDYIWRGNGDGTTVFDELAVSSVLDKENHFDNLTWEHWDYFLIKLQIDINTIAYDQTALDRLTKPSIECSDFLLDARKALTKRGAVTAAEKRQFSRKGDHGDRPGRLTPLPQRQTGSQAPSGVSDNANSTWTPSTSQTLESRRAVSQWVAAGLVDTHSGYRSMQGSELANTTVSGWRRKGQSEEDISLDW